MSRDVQTSLYRLLRADGQLLYVGISLNLGVRWKTHSGKKPDWSLVARAEVEHYPSRDAALDAERTAIQTERPIWNVVHNRGIRMFGPGVRPAPTSTTDPNPGTSSDAAILAEVTALAEKYRHTKARHEKAVRVLRRAEAERVAAAAVVEALRKPLQQEIVAAAKAGRSPKVICELTGYGPERVRQLLRAAGVEPFERP
ncbi:GIY-YIG nuclease family protein [Micromonospora haikouensis]|uniref:GIY-YIG nuclease family protein n=1 Tax=Micromonospora haikouensis TaxID=686309 RepID=UPI00367BB3A8